jgi:hypothetical protein
VTICSSGRIEENLESGFYDLFLKFLEEEENVFIPFSAYAVVNSMKVNTD